jgi:hypothetical protein
MNRDNKLTIIYSFKLVEGKEEDFIRYWTALTQMIYEFEGSYGSRLHKVNDCLYIGYAQWPNKEIYDNSGNNLPETSTTLRKKMRECCAEIKSEFEMVLVQDLLKDKTYQAD